MAEKTKAPEKAPVTPAPEPTYKAEEFAANSEKVFGHGINSDIVMATFMVNGVKEATVPKAKEMVKRFVTKEVK
ncbi:MAG: hypothetical protein J6N19_06525 [Clostridium sp.]|nr:hypothetical protein [Clostridium sp.]